MLERITKIREKIRGRGRPDSEEKINYTKSQSGEDLPKTEREYIPWIREQILEEVKKGSFAGINPNAHGLRDDLRAWAYMGEEATPSDEEQIALIDEIMSLLPKNSKIKNVVDYACFIVEARDVKKRAQAHLSEKSQEQKGFTGILE